MCLRRFAAAIDWHTGCTPGAFVKSCAPSAIDRMPYGLYISAEGALAQSRRLDVIANNLANVDTTGFKRDLALFQARYAEETARGQDVPGSGSLNDLGGGVMTHGTPTDFSPSTLKRTGQPQDMAIRGEGFFVVRQEGHDYLTRAGNFVLTAAGELQTTDGASVLSEGGGPVLIDPGVPWTLTPDGSVLQAGGLTPLALAMPASYGDLVKVGDNLFHALVPPLPMDPSQRQVVSGFLEQSGVNPTREMVAMIEASRAFEANISLIRNQDQMLGGLVSRVLRST
jgi:flagellar basal-body rod protein FlgF/flagellar basal-body rod protein FlgG